MTHDYPLCAINNEGPKIRQEREVSEVYFLLNNICGTTVLWGRLSSPFPLFSRAFLFFRHLPNNETQHRLEWGGIGHIPLDAFFNRILRLC